MEKYNYQSNNDVNQPNDQINSQPNNQADDANNTHQYNQPADDNGRNERKNNSHEKYLASFIGGVAVSSIVVATAFAAGRVSAKFSPQTDAAIYYNNGSPQTNSTDNTDNGANDNNLLDVPDKSLWATPHDLQNDENAFNEFDDKPAVGEYMDEHGDGVTTKEIMAQAGVTDIASIDDPNSEDWSRLALAMQRTLDSTGYESTMPSTSGSVRDSNNNVIANSGMATVYGQIHFDNDKGEMLYGCTFTIDMSAVTGNNKFRISLSCLNPVNMKFIKYGYFECSEIPSAETVQKLLEPQFANLD